LSANFSAEETLRGGFFTKNFSGDRPFLLRALFSFFSMTFNSITRIDGILTSPSLLLVLPLSRIRMSTMSRMINLCFFFFELCHELISGKFPFLKGPSAHLTPPSTSALICPAPHCCVSSKHSSESLTSVYGEPSLFSISSRQVHDGAF